MKNTITLTALGLGIASIAAIAIAQNTQTSQSHSQSQNGTASAWAKSSSNASSSGGQNAFASGLGAQIIAGEAYLIRWAPRQELTVQQGSQALAQHHQFLANTKDENVIFEGPLQGSIGRLALYVGVEKGAKSFANASPLVKSGAADVEITPWQIEYSNAYRLSKNGVAPGSLTNVGGSQVSGDSQNSTNGSQSQSTQTSVGRN
ncbi:MAG: hypothetical protein KDC26_10205 [Armatimonadetes bacterium]|nr:hypothetical protein [Armatimonadota bacterium]